MRRSGLIAAALALSAGASVAAPARAQQPSANEERLAKQVEAQQADIAEQETRIRDLEKKLSALLAKQKEKEAEKPAAPAAPAAPPPAPPAIPVVDSVKKGLDSVLPDFLRDFRLSGHVQAQYESHQDSEDQLRPGGDPLNQNRFVLRRARLRIERDWQYASIFMDIDANTVRGPSIAFQHAEASVLYRGNRPFSAPPILKLTFGLFDVPFGAELLENPQQRWFMERTLLSRSFFPAEPDLGVRLSSALGWFRATVALTNGEPLGVRDGFALRDPNSGKDVVVRVAADVEPTDWLHLVGGVNALTGKGFHAGSDATKGTIQWTDINEDGFVQPTELSSVPSSSAVSSQTFNRWAIGADLRLAFKTPIGKTTLDGSVVLANNMDRGLFIADPILTGIDNRELGFLVAATQEFFGYGVVGFRFDQYNPNADAQDRQGGKLLPVSQTVRTFSPLVGLALPDRARLLFQYDVIRDKLGRDPRGVPTDLRNDTWTLRMQVNL